MANELILIVEDNPKNLKLVRDTLQVKGYQTIEAETGEEGVHLARQRQPALILMDISVAWDEHRSPASAAGRIH
jgi:two-component system cell cycle response regulator DivK